MANKKLNSITFPNMPNDRYYLDADKVNYDPEATYRDGSTGKALQSKAEIDGYYSEMSVGDAEQLISSMYVEDAEPYNYRTTGGSADVGNREYVDAIVGGTIAWNQQAYNGDFHLGDSGWGITPAWKSHIVSDGTLHLVSNANQTAVTFISTDVKNIVKHVYLLSLSIKSSKATEFSGAVGGVSGGGAFITTPYSANVWTHIVGISKVHTFTYNTLYLRPKATVDEEEVSIDLKNVMLIDLTQMFGSTIADYIYGLEQANAGAGTAWFKKLFPKDYYAYNAGELMSVNALRHDTVGFNQWDEEWEVGAISLTTGENTSSASSVRSKNYIHVVPNATYCVTFGSGSMAIAGYDADKNFLANLGGYTSGRTLTIPENCRYIRFYVYNGYGTTYKNDICINLSWSGWRNGDYEPYDAHSYALDDSLTLRGIPKLDASNNVYYDGDVYEPDGTVTRKYGIVDMGTLAWTSVNNTSKIAYFRWTDAKFIASDYNVMNAVCPKYQVVSRASLGYGSNFTVEGIGIDQNGNFFITFPNNDWANTAAVKTGLSGVYLVYELATPTTEEAEPYSGVQICNDFGTEEYVDASVEAGTRDVAIPVGHQTRYPANLRDKLQHLPDLADNDGYYMIGQTNKQMHLELFRIPKAPTSPDGTYVLQATVSGGTPTYTWVDPNAESEVTNG